MQGTRFKSAHTTRHGINPSKNTILHIFLAGAGFFGALVFGFLMDSKSASIGAAFGTKADREFTSFADSLVIPGFMLSVCVCAYGVYQLFKVYRQLNDPKSYGNRSRRTPR